MKAPELVKHEFMEGSTFSIAEFEYEDTIGSIAYRSDGQCDVDALSISKEKTVFNEYRILISNNEICEFLASVYSSVKNENT